MPLALLCDEHVLFPVIQGLRRRGIDVAIVQEAGLRSASDEAILEAARTQRRVIYTSDVDFLRLHVAFRTAASSTIARVHTDIRLCT